MRPFVFDWNFHGHVFRLPSNGVMLAIAFSAAYFWSLRRAIKANIDPKHVENLFLIIVFASILGSRLFHVFFEEWDYYKVHPEKIFAIWEGGYTFYGAVLAATLGIYLYCRFQKVSFLPFADLASPSAALGLFFGRIGCFLAGCCWGRPTKLPWGVVFTNPQSFAPTHTLPLHPTQLYESFGGLLLFFYLEWLWTRRKYAGQIFFHALAGYSILRFVVEIFRGDDYRGYVFNGMLSYSQLISLVILPFAIAGMIVYSKQRLSETNT